MVAREKERKRESERKGECASMKSEKDKVINDDGVNMCGNIGTSTVDDSLAKNLRIVKYRAYELPIRVLLIFTPRGIRNERRR